MSYGCINVSFSITDEGGDAQDENKRYSRDSEGKLNVHIKAHSCESLFMLTEFFKLQNKCVKV